MHDPVHGLSLGSRLGHPQKVLTSSAKVNSKGEMIDFKVRAAIIRNIHVVTHDDVNAAPVGFLNGPLGILTANKVWDRGRHHEL